MLNSVGILLFDFLCFVSIYFLAPYNHPGLHLTSEERNALVCASRRTTIILILGDLICTYGGLASIAKGIASGIAMAAFSLCLAYIADWRKTHENTKRVSQEDDCQSCY